MKKIALLVCVGTSLARMGVTKKEIYRMRTKKLAVVVLGLCSLLLLTVAPAGAHHAFSSEYDSTRPVELQGTITRVELINPHSWIMIDVRLDDGTTEAWEIEAGAPNSLYRRGFTRDSLPVGTEITVRGYRAKAEGLRRANGGSITTSDGSTIFLGGSNPDRGDR